MQQRAFTILTCMLNSNDIDDLRIGNPVFKVPRIRSTAFLKDECLKLNSALAFCGL